MVLTVRWTSTSAVSIVPPSIPYSGWTTTSLLSTSSGGPSESLSSPSPAPPPAEKVALDDPATIAWYAKVDEIVANIEQAYSDDPPEPFNELRSVVSSRRPEALTHGLVGVWREVVRHHRHSRERDNDERQCL